MPTTILKPSGDTYVSQWYSNQNFSQSEYLLVGFEYRRRNVCKSLLKFALPSPPADMVLTRAVLMLPLKDIEGGHEVTINVNRVLNAYDNATVTWNTMPAYVPVSGTFTVDCHDAGHCVETDITELVKGWDQGIYPNYGLALTSDSGRGGTGDILKLQQLLWFTAARTDIQPPSVPADRTDRADGTDGTDGRNRCNGRDRCGADRADGCDGPAGQSGRTDRADGCDRADRRNGRDRRSADRADRADGCSRRNRTDGRKRAQQAQR